MITLLRYRIHKMFGHPDMWGSHGYNETVIGCACGMTFRFKRKF